MSNPLAYKAGLIHTCLDYYPSMWTRGTMDY
nr:MAG TPA: hypothetical protein [Caudoviricetes sp.]